MKLTCLITIGDYEYTGANNIAIESGFDMLTETCEITLPTKGVLADINGKKTALSFEDIISTGMTVKVQLGYDFDNKTEFVGYVSGLTPKIPLKINCENEMYIYKRANAISAIYNGTLKGLLTKYFPTAKLSENIPDVPMRNFHINRCTPAEILQKICDEYLLSAYFREKVLFVGLPFTDVNATTKSFVNQNPVVYILNSPDTNVITDNLIFRRKEDQKIKITAVSILANGSKIEIKDIGDKDGENRTIHFRGVTDKNVMEQQAKAMLDKLKYSGLSGDFTAFLDPYVQHSDTIRFFDDLKPEKNGVYLAKKVTTTWGVSGGRRKVQLGVRVG